MQASDRKSKIGLWVLCQGQNKFLDSKESAIKLVELVKKNQITDVFLQVFRTGRAWFNSEIFESGCAESFLPLMLEQLSIRGVATHAWINVCNAGLQSSQKYLSLLGGGEALMRDGKGRDSLCDLESFHIDTPGLWLEPSNPLLISTLEILVKELNQFSFSGLHLDFIRYPYTLPMKPASWIDVGIDFGYSAPALARFSAQNTVRQNTVPQNTVLRNNTGHFGASKAYGQIPCSEEAGLLFDTWRRQQIRNLVATCKHSISADRKLSVAALAWSDRAYLSAYQDWREWLASNLIDALCLMSYSADTHLITQQIKQAQAFLQSKQELFAGIGLYKLANSAELRSQLVAINSLAAFPCYFCADRLSQLQFDR